MTKNNSKEPMKKYYTIYLGNKIWENVVDDMNSTEIWAEGGMVWKTKKKALACVSNLKKYGFETEKKKFSIRKLIATN